MALVDIENRSIVAKVVYFGPARSGKTTNLAVLHDLLPEERRGNAAEFEPDGQSTIFCDYIPVNLGSTTGFDITLRLFTVSGQEGRADARRAVLTGADGVIFVADTAAGKDQENIASMRELEQCLAELHPSAPDSVPIVIQYNKLDLPEKSEPEALMRGLNRSGHSVVFASSLERRGVAETLDTMIQEVLARL